MSVRNSPTISAIEARLAGLVHDRVHGDPVERTRHERFIVTRMLGGLLALAGLPPYLLWRGVPTAVEAMAIVCLVVPIVAALLLSRTGILALAHAVSSASLASLIVCVAAVSGGLGSAATVWLAGIPLEALLSGSRRAALAAVGIATVAVTVLAGLDAAGISPDQELWPFALAMPIFAITAIAHAAALALEHSRLEGERRASLSERDAYDRSLLHAIDDLVSWHDRNGHVLRASTGASKLFGAAPGLVGRGLLGRVHVSDRPAFLKAISDAATSEQPVAVQFRLHVGPQSGVERDGGPRVIWAETRAHRVDALAPADKGLDRGVCVIAVTRDVTEHKRHAEELERAKAEAERADLSKGRFLATVSHELRTPLNAIIGFSEVLSAEHGFDLGVERRKEYAQIIHQSGQHLLGVVNTLLDMSKIETGNFDFVPEPFDMAALVTSCCDLMQLKADQASIAIAREVAGDLPELVADLRACRQILINLISNAVKFTPRGGRITVALRRDGDRLAVSVADTGVGIAACDLPRLGDPFFQAGSSYARSHEGTGLGLSVVRGLVGLHHGEIAVESAPGEGTTVTVLLPIEGRVGRAPLGPIQVQTSMRMPSNVAPLRAIS